MARKGEEALDFGDGHKVAHLLARRERFERPVFFRRFGYICLLASFHGLLNFKRMFG